MKRILLFILLLFLIKNNNLYSQVPTAEKNALLAFYNSTNGPNWEMNNTNWNTSNPVSTWFGITVTNISGIDHVTAIDICCTQNMTGSIPPEIGNLTFLNKLYLTSHDNLTGSIPSEIGNLINLTYLSFSQNNLIGSIPSEIGNLTDLEYLFLWSNQLAGNIPPEIGNLINLKSLGLDENSLTGSIPSELSNLTMMRNFWVADNNLEGDITNIYSSWPNLGILGIKNTLLTGDLDLSNNPNLRVLWAENNSLSTINVRNGTNSTMLNNNNVNVSNSSNLTCVQVDNETDANNGNPPYTNWSYDSTVLFSENCSALSVIDYSLSKNLLFYPNPTDSFLFIKNNSYPINEVNIYNVLGKKIASINKKTHIEKVDFSNLKKGVYFIQTKDSQNIIRLNRIIKE
jgi:hypothetical protein